MYRGDSRHPDEIFEHGFRPKGDSNNLLLHSLDSNKPPSNFVSTSPDREIGINFATNFNMRGGFLYSIRMIPGRDLKSELGPHTNLIANESWQSRVESKGKIFSELHLWALTVAHLATPH